MKGDSNTGGGFLKQRRKGAKGEILGVFLLPRNTRKRHEQKKFLEWLRYLRDIGVPHLRKNNCLSKTQTGLLVDRQI
jgi:hypothetical protein